MTIDTYTREQRESLIRAKQDIELFLRLASDRIDNRTNVLPFPRMDGNIVISWLRALLTRYAAGEDITK